MKKRIFRLLVIPVSVVAALYGYASLYDRTPQTKTFIDRDGKLIGTLNADYQGFQVWSSLSDFPPQVISKTLSSEDRFFKWHPGINPVSLFKAALANISRGRIVRGGSTLTQQLAKNLIQHQESEIELKPLPRTFANKIRETFLALGLEVKHSKEWILERYLNSVYYGHRCYGFASAAHYYFGKNPKELSDDEVDFLIRLPKAPGVLPKGFSDKSEATVARHMMDFLNTRSDLPSRIETTLDRDLQKTVEETVHSLLAPRLEKDPLLTAAVVVLDVRTGDVLSLVGSRDYFEESVSGQYNAAVALRQPGSTLKPFTYFAAFLKGYSSETVVSDAPTSFHVNEENAEGYAPQNFDRHFHGDVTVRQALANSYNVPAVVTLNDIGLSYYHGLLKKFGFVSLTKPPSYYGLAVTLGAGEVSLLELTNAYAALSRGGRYRPYRFLKSEALVSLKDVSLDAPRAAAQITSILTDPKARLKAFGFNENLIVEGHDVAVKTGTSYEHRDNWTVGYTPSYAVGVWVGHADGTPMDATTGASGAAPLWHAIFERLLRGKPAEAFPISPKVDPSLQASLSRPTNPSNGAPLQRGSQELAKMDWQVLSPVPYTRFRTHAYLPKEHQSILAVGRAKQNTRLNWYLDGSLIEKTSDSKPRVWLAPTPGRHVLRVESEHGEKQEIPFFVVENETNSF